MKQKVTLLTAADLHRSAALLNELRGAVARHRPNMVALVGDFLHAGEDNQHRVSVPDCAKMLAGLPCSVILFIRGNHEDEAWLEFAEAWKKTGRPMYQLHGEAFTYGPLALVGFPCALGDETAFIGDRSPLPFESEEWLLAVIESIGVSARTLWLMHEPPTGTPLSKPDSITEGNPEWVTAIERYSPWLTISGHDHITPINSKCWHHRLGKTTCVNVGQSNHGPLHYTLVETFFNKESRSLPVRLRVSAFPWQESITLPAGEIKPTKSNS